jgi:hypothetical protein
VKPTTFVTLNTRARITIGINLRNKIKDSNRGIAGRDSREIKLDDGDNK